MDRLIFNYNSKEYQYCPKTGYLLAKQTHLAEDDTPFTIDAYILEIPSDLKEVFLSFLPLNSEVVIKSLKNILSIYNKGVEDGKSSKQEEIRKALGL